MTVAVTPNGLADGITYANSDILFGKEECFVMPDEVTMKMKDFLHNLEHPRYVNNV